MASSKVMSRLSSRLQPLALKLSKQSLSLELSTLKSTAQSQVSVSSRRISRISRLPLELSSLGSTMALHNAVASARLVSSLPVESCGWGLVPQGISMPL
ncbi:Protein NUCLEAR FUSION DEFECTIVE 6 like [Quillaja saponaria]|uniref:Protein NUCLEAR FUSION DEFECTIVE 6 like n=1 Tax=Quillaja saponaria TaxID=32244 RepID=A0AAD7Q2S7_QUISA|nr:Protein NUCLEAR FUSION DEFECTIVE 6 like [Quillaja saponaria]